MGVLNTTSGGRMNPTIGGNINSEIISNRTPFKNYLS